MSVVAADDDAMHGYASEADVRLSSGGNGGDDGADVDMNWVAAVGVCMVVNSVAIRQFRPTANSGSAAWRCSCCRSH